MAAEQPVKHMNQSDSAGMVHCWKKLLAAWEPASAVEAGQLLTAGTLFKDKSEAGFEAPTEGEAGFEAGFEADEPADTAEGAAEWATAEPEEDDYMQYFDFDWDRYDAEAAEQGGEWTVVKATMSRSARVLMEGWVRVPTQR